MSLASQLANFPCLEQSGKMKQIQKLELVKRFFVLQRQRKNKPFDFDAKINRKKRRNLIARTKQQLQRTNCKKANWKTQHLIF